MTAKTIYDLLGTLFIDPNELGDAVWTVKIVEADRLPLAEIKSRFGGKPGDPELDGENVAFAQIANARGEVHPRLWKLNATNVHCAAAMYGPSPREWIGKRIYLHRQKDVFMGKPGIRISGSPDIERDLEVTIPMGRKKPVRVTMRRELAQKAKPDAKPAPAPQKEPG